METRTNRAECVRVITQRTTKGLYRWRIMSWHSVVEEGYEQNRTRALKVGRERRQKYFVTKDGKETGNYVDD